MKRTTGSQLECGEETHSLKSQGRRLDEASQGRAMQSNSFAPDQSHQGCNGTCDIKKCGDCTPVISALTKLRQEDCHICGQHGLHSDFQASLS